MARAAFAFLGGGQLSGGGVIAILAGRPNTISANIGKMGPQLQFSPGGQRQGGGELMSWVFG